MNLSSRLARGIAPPWRKERKMTKDQLKDEIIRGLVEFNRLHYQKKRVVEEWDNRLKKVKLELDSLLNQLAGYDAQSGPLFDKPRPEE
jgi:hypothetical protein